MSDTLSTIGADRRRTRAHAARETARHAPPADLGAQWRRTLRRWPTILATWLVVAALAVLAGLLWPQSYQATASLTVTPAAVNPLTGESGEEEIEMHTEAATLSSQQVALRAAADLEDVPFERADPKLAEELLEAADTEAPSQSQVLRVTVSDTDPQEAADRANALAAAYLEDRAGTVTAAAEAAVERLDDSIASLSKDDTQDSAVEQLREQRTAASLIAPTPGRIISDAVAPENPSSAGLLLFTAGGLVGGLVLGVLAGLLRERTDRSVHRPERLAEAGASSVVTLRSEDDEDGALELLRLLARDGEGSVPGPGSRLAVHSARPGQAEVAVRALRSVLEQWGGTVELVDEETLTSAVGPLDDWLTLQDAPPTVLLAVVPPRTSTAQLAALTDRIDGLVVTVDARSELSRSRGLLDRLAGRRAAVVPAFVLQRQARPAPAGTTGA